MTRILLVSNTDWYLYNFRINLALFLRRNGFEVIFISPSGPYADRLQGLGFRWRVWRLGRKSLAPWKEAAAFAEIVSLYRSERPDLVHHHTIKPALYGSLAARISGVTAIVNSITGRGSIFSGGNNNGLAQRMVRRLYRLAFSSDTCRVIFENRADLNYFLENRMIPAGRVHLIESVGVDHAHFTPMPDPDGTPVVLLASRMLWEKGVGILVQAARELKQRINVRIVLVGEPDPGNPSSIPERVLKGWHAEGVIEWWGFQSDMPSIYQAAHLVVLPTIYAEGVPTVLIEAGACARAVIASDMPGCRDVIVDQQTGLLVPPNDAAALAAAIERLILDPGLRGKMGAAGRQRIVEKYTSELVNHSTLDVYRRLLPDPK